MRSIKHKLVVLFAGVLTVALGATATVLMANERARITADITQSVVHFAELSGERIADLYDLYYRSQSYALFDAELRSILDREPAVDRVQIALATGELLFDSSLQPEELTADTMVDMATRQRLTVNRLSVTAGDRTAFLTREDDASATYLAADIHGVSLPDTLLGSAVEAVIFPLSDDRRRVILHPSYAEVQEQTIASMLSLGALFFFAFAGSLLVSTWFAGTITRPLAALRDGALRISRGELDAKIQVRSHDETQLLADTFNTMTSELASAVDTKIEFERAQKEFEVARDIQESILPSVVDVPGLDVGVVFRPASEVGGDVYDVVETVGGKKLIYLGDATGHGVPAGMVAALTSAVMSAAARTSDDLGEILTRANEILHQKTKSNMFVTVMALLWDEEQGTLTYANAGHEPFLICTTTGEVRTGETGSMGLGMLGQLVPYPVVRTIDVADGEVLMVMTDGIFEAETAAGGQLEMAGLTEIARAAVAGHSSAADIATDILARFDKATTGKTQEDDVTYFVIKK